MNEVYSKYFLDSLKKSPLKGYLRMNVLFGLGIFLTVIQSNFIPNKIPALCLVFPLPLYIFQTYWLQITMDKIMIKHSIDHKNDISKLEKMVKFSSYVFWFIWLLIILIYCFNLLNIDVENFTQIPVLIQSLQIGCLTLAIPSIFSFYLYERKWKRLIYHAEEKIGLTKIGRIRLSLFILPVAYFRLHKRIHHLIFSDDSL